ncbi:hypothetical protein KA013_00480 [Patescibacteria group bacterium]|nr:hypothetical protein [Patescibacteria group bacterium]
MTGSHDLHCGQRFPAITKQLPTKSPGGDLIFIPTVNGAKQSVTHNHAVSVGET